MSSENRPLPPAAEAAHRILAEHGPLTAMELRDRLRSDQFVLAIERVLQLPDRFPHRFAVSTNGRLSIATTTAREAAAEPDEEDSDTADWYRP